MFFPMVSETPAERHVRFNMLQLYMEGTSLLMVMGYFRIVDNATGSNVINVCAGTQTTITLRDNSTWNCQNPVLPGALTAVPNTDPRNIEWLYGRDPSGCHNKYNYRSCQYCRTWCRTQSKRPIISNCSTRHSEPGYYNSCYMCCRTVFQSIS